jgi:hypothetical protein
MLYWLPEAKQEIEACRVGLSQAGRKPMKDNVCESLAINTIERRLPYISTVYESFAFSTPSANDRAFIK